MTGPPRSKHIMSPRMIPRNTAEPPPDMEVSPFCSAVMREARGRPSSMYITAPTASVVPSGMMTTGISPRSQAGTLSPVSQAAT